MPDPRHTFRWSPAHARPDDPERDVSGLMRDFERCAEDSVASGQEIVREASGRLLAWLQAGSVPDELESQVRHVLRPLKRAHAWRGAVAQWLLTLARTFEFARSAPQLRAVSAREVLAEELGLWLGGADADPFVAWNGEPLASGARLVSVAGLEPDHDQAPFEVGAFDPGELVLVHGHAEPVTAALLAIARAGLRPRVIVSEGGSDLAGRRTARALAERGVDVEYVYDLALQDLVPSADRVFLGTEAVGAEGFVACLGTRALLREARRTDVPRTLFATRCELMPEGALLLPECGVEDAWLLWDEAPEGVRVRTQTHEIVPLDLASTFRTDAGLETAAEFALRALWTDASLSSVPSEVPL